MESTAAEVRAVPDAAVDAKEAVAMPVTKAPTSIVVRFLEARGLERRKPLGEQPAKTAPSSVVVAARIPTRTMWHGYTKLKCGTATAFCRRAMSVPDESFRESVDVYNPQKRPTRLIKIHEDADQVSQEFLYRARSLLFEREVVDRPVCDLLKNRDQCDDDLDRVYAWSDGEIAASDPTHHAQTIQTTPGDTRLR